MAKTKKEVKVQDIQDKCVILGKELNTLKQQYTEHYNAMQGIEKQVTAKAGAMSALQALLVPLAPKQEETK